MANLFYFLLPFCLSVQKPQPVQHISVHIYPNVTRTFFRLGDQLITLQRNGAGNRSILIVGLHNNEQTAIMNASFFAEGCGASFLQLVHSGAHNIKANLMDQTIAFDPDKIYTPVGRKFNLKNNQSWSKHSAQQVGMFARCMVNQFMHKDMIVSVHETDKNENINNYTSLPELMRITKDVNINASSDPQDFMITTDENWFMKLKQQYNVVLLNKHKLKDDGSLSIYCIRTDKPYVQIQTLADHTSMQNNMLHAVCMESN